MCLNPNHNHYNHTCSLTTHMAFNIACIMYLRQELSRLIEHIEYMMKYQTNVLSYELLNLNKCYFMCLLVEQCVTCGKCVTYHLANLLQG